MTQCTDFVYAFPIRPTSSTNNINCRYSVKLEQLFHPCSAGVAETLHCSFSLWHCLIDPRPPPPPPSLPHLMKIDLFCLDFHSAFRLRGFSLQCQLYISSKCVAVIKEKASQPGPRQQAKVDTNVIETGYWYSPCWTPAHLGGELFLLCTWSLEVFLSEWVFCSFMFCVCKTAWVSCHFLFSCFLSSSVIGSVQICQSDILMHSQARSDFWSSSDSPLLEISIQPMKGLHFPGCKHHLQNKIFSARFMAAHEAIQTNMWVNIIHWWLMLGGY